MKKQPLSREEMEARYAGTTINDIQIVTFLRNEPYESSSGRLQSRWICLAKCVCGREYESLFNTIRRNPHPSCGCRRQAPGAKWRMEFSSKKSTEKPKKEKSKKSSSLFDLSHSAIYDSSVRLSVKRLQKLWSELNPEECCLAWRGDPEAFCAWGLLHGFAREKRLVRIDEHLPYHPLNCRWSE